jgi:hypothetical protein
MSSYINQYSGQLSLFGCTLGWCRNEHIWVRWCSTKGICLRWGYYQFSERLNNPEWKGHVLSEGYGFKYIFHIKCLRLRLFWVDKKGGQ